MAAALAETAAADGPLTPGSVRWSSRSRLPALAEAASADGLASVLAERAPETDCADVNDVDDFDDDIELFIGPHVLDAVPSGAFRITPKQPAQAGADKFGGFQTTCPFHKKNASTGCKKLQTVAGRGREAFGVADDAAFVKLGNQVRHAAAPLSCTARADASIRFH